MIEYFVTGSTHARPKSYTYPCGRKLTRLHLGDLEALIMRQNLIFLMLIFQNTCHRLVKNELAGDKYFKK
jgi:hypothetical protein